MDIMCIDEMKLSGRFPIPEALLNRPKNYELTIDSFLRTAYSEEATEAQANYKDPISAPANSEESGDEFNLYETSETEEIVPNDEEYEDEDDFS
jgi:hypothetical protein